MDKSWFSPWFTRNEARERGVVASDAQQAMALRVRLRDRAGTEPLEAAPRARPSASTRAEADRAVFDGLEG